MRPPAAFPGGYDVTVVGGGVVGAAIAFGLAEGGQRVAVLDEGDRAQRAARTNFGLAWLQSKGDGMPAYMRWTRRSTDLWPQFAARLKEASGVDTEYRKLGGVVYCLSDVEWDEQRARIARLGAQAAVFDSEMIDRGRLEKLMPEARFGAEMVGASYCPHDGHLNPLLLLRALHAAMQRAGVRYLPETAARGLRYQGRRFVVDTASGAVESGKVVLAAGHGTPALAEAVGINAPIYAQRGQILVTERLRPFLPIPGSGLRQTEDGTVLIGSSKEDTGFDDRTTVAVGVQLASRALRIIPELARVRLQRTWGGIRVLTGDGHPIYAQSERCPGAFVALCHSGVTLAAVHAADLARAVQDGALPESMSGFHPGRFDVQKAA